MHPFKIFIFASVLLAVAFLFRYEQAWTEQELPPIAAKITIEEVKPLQIDSLAIPATDSVYGFFEGCNPDSCLANFTQLLLKSKDTLIRIVFFGDSQLEGDFFTMPVRKAFQQIYGGNAIGYMPAEMYFNTTEKVAIVTSDFEKYVVHSVMAETNEFGLYGRFFLPTKSSAELRIKNRDRNHRYNSLKIIYSGKVNLEVDSGEKNRQKMVLDSPVIAEKILDFEDTPSDLKLIFTDNQQLKLYGILLDPLTGVVVDHLPFRGNLNLMLNCFGDESVSQMSNLLNPSLVVLQYGLNVIPDVRTNYENYRIALQRDIQLLKKYLPETSIVIIGAPDMAHKDDGVMCSYKNIELIIASQKQAAQAEGVAFWNMRKAMGGEGSVIKWVAEDLARTDYAHLNAKGSEKMAKVFTKDLLHVINKNSVENDRVAEK